MEPKIKGVFNGTGMLGDNGKLYPINPNYISKSRLLVGDRLELCSINGSLVYKQIESVPRRRVLGVMNDYEEVVVESVAYKTTHASITFFHLNPGDEVICLIPEDGEGWYTAIDDKIIIPDEEY
jgi:hypothetical protein